MDGIDAWYAERIVAKLGARLYARDSWADFTAWREALGLPMTAFWFRRVGFHRQFNARAAKDYGAKRKKYSCPYLTDVALAEVETTL